MGKPMKVTKSAKEMGKPPMGAGPMPKGKGKPGLTIVIGVGKAPKKDGKR